MQFLYNPPGVISRFFANDILFLTVVVVVVGIVFIHQKRYNNNGNRLRSSSEHRRFNCVSGVARLGASHFPNRTPEWLTEDEQCNIQVTNTNWTGPLENGNRISCGFAEKWKREEKESPQREMHNSITYNKPDYYNPVRNLSRNLPSCFCILFSSCSSFTPNFSFSVTCSYTETRFVVKDMKRMGSMERGTHIKSGSVMC